MLDSVDYLCVTGGTAQKVLKRGLPWVTLAWGFGGLLLLMSGTAQKVFHVGCLA